MDHVFFTIICYKTQLAYLQERTWTYVTRLFTTMFLKSREYILVFQMSCAILIMERSI